MRPFFITSSGTGIGKTLVTASLCRQLRAGGKRVTALKPVISGYDPKDAESDTAVILRSCGLEPALALVEKVSPWRYAAPLAPAMAAAQEGNPVDMHKLAAFCCDAPGDYVFVEGVGGIMTPLTDRHTVLDWMTALGWPVILVGGSYLGAISHTLVALEVLLARALPVRVVVASESADSSVSLADTVAMLEKFVPGHIPVVQIVRLQATKDVWKEAPPFGWISDI